MENNASSNSGVIVGILIAVVIGIVAWVAYTQGFFTAKEAAKEDSSGLEINIGDTSDTDAK